MGLLFLGNFKMGELYSIRNAILLAAGSGTRLRPLTNEIPKCLVEVGNKGTILINLLYALKEVGVENLVIVAGYKAVTLQNYVSKYNFSNLTGLNIIFVENPDYEKNNSMFSTSLGLDHIEGGTWIVESDIMIDSHALKTEKNSELLWFVDSSMRSIGGSVLTINKQSIVTAIRIERDTEKIRNDESKSVGIFRANAAGAKKLKNLLKTEIKEGNSNLYLDLIIAKHIHEIEVMSEDIKGKRWFEIDDAHDLEEAKSIFL